MKEQKCFFKIVKFFLLCVFLIGGYLFLYRLLVPELPIPYEYISSNQPTVVKRGTVFASYSKNGRIADYVVRYLEELKKADADIVFIADSPIYPSEVNKIKDLVIYAKFERHTEYDFGSYKRGLQYFLKNKQLGPNSHLILCNDSVYGPFYPLSDIFDEMNQKPIDFWGMTMNIDIHPHIQSYFLYFQNSKLIHNELAAFLGRVKHEKKVHDVIMKYEVPLTEYVRKHGYNVGIYTPIMVMFKKTDQYFRTDMTTFRPMGLIEEDHFPFVKRKIFKPEMRFHHPRIAEITLKYIEQNFPDFYQIIKADLLQQGFFDLF